MDGRAEGTSRIERDPTMDNRIVHAVCVSNKKEQCHLRDRERNLQNEFIVEQHIIRREEKSLLKQFQKLQLEKYHRHGDEMHSPRPSSRGLILPHSARSRHSSHRGLINSPMTSRHRLPASQHVHHHSSHTSNASAKHPSYQSSSIISNNASSFASSGFSLASSADNSLPNIDRTVRHGISQDYQHRKESEDGHRHDRHHSRGAVNNEIASLVDSYLVPHQPAGYGHSIKEISGHKELYRYRAQKGIHKQRRHHLDFDYPGNYCHVGNLHLLNDVLGPYSGMYHSKLSKPDLQKKKTEADDDVSRETSSQECQPKKQSSSLLNLSSQRATDTDCTESTAMSGNETMERERKTSLPENLQISIKISRKKHQDKKHAMKKPYHGTTTALATDHPSIHAVRRTESKQSAGSSYHSIHRQAANHNQPAPASAAAESGGSRELVPFIRFSQSTEDVKKGPSFASQISTRSNNKHHKLQGSKVQDTIIGNHPANDFELPASTLAELEAICGSSTQGYYNNQPGGFGNRRTRFKQLVKELLLKQMPAVTRKRHLAEFDPLEALQCRYLRLSPSNIDELVAACKEAGVDVELHPHSNVTDINEYVFGKKSEQ